ncbi:putative ankyrin repeat containing protein [Halotydeus destructor]|nr:putative ankyrin repeat containing protein [Halotydeus destructor]
MLLVKKDHDINEPDRTGRTVLHYAAEQGLNDEVQQLIQAGALSMCDSQRRHTLYSAIRGNHVETVQLLLLNFKETTNVRDGYLRSPMTRALQANQPDILDLLLRRAEFYPKLIETVLQRGLVDCLKKILQFKPCLVDLYFVERVHFSPQCVPCLKLLLSAGFRLNMTRFRNRPHLCGIFLDEKYYNIYENAFPDNEHGYRIWFHDHTTPEDAKAFTELQDQNGRLSRPLSLMQLAQWAIYATCRDIPIQEIVKNIELPKSVASFLLFYYLN